MSKCPNCGSAITCGCQKRILSNGKSGCTKCAAKQAKNLNAPPNIKKGVNDTLDHFSETTITNIE